MNLREQDSASGVVIAALEYSPRPAWHKRGQLRRITLLCIIIGIGGAAWLWGRKAIDRTSMLYWQHRCLTYSAPPDQIVYEQNPRKAAALLKDANYVGINDGRPGSPTFAGRKAAPLEKLMPFLPRPAPILPPAATGSALLFMHELRTAAGERRLVVLESAFSKDAPPLFIVGYDVNAGCYDPGTWKMPIVDRTSGYIIDVLNQQLTKPADFRVFAGQPDPADSSHFTMTFELNAKRGIVDAYLKDGGHLELKVRQTP